MQLQSYYVTLIVKSVSYYLGLALGYVRVRIRISIKIESCRPATLLLVPTCLEG